MKPAWLLTLASCLALARFGGLEIFFSYSIFLDPARHELFAYAEIESEARWQAIAATDVCRRWWRHMSEIMPSNPRRKPGVQRPARGLPPLVTR